MYIWCISHGSPYLFVHNITIIFSSSYGCGILYGHLRYDLVDLTRQALAKYANQLFLKVIESYQRGDLPAVSQLSQKFLILVEDMDTLLACHDGFLLGPWLESAKKLAQNEEQEKQVCILSK